MKIQLPELDVVVGNNGFWTGLVLKKHLTFGEGLDNICPMMFLQMVYAANYLHLL